MSAFYDEMADVVLELLTEFGQQVTISRSVGGEYDPVTGVDTEPTVETQIATVVVLPASKGTVEAFDIKYEGGTLIESNLRALKIAAKGLSWPPGPGCSVELDGHKWVMIGATESSPAGTDLIYSSSVMR